MPPVPPERFARLFRGLDADERVGFVATLWRDRGWETTVDGTTVVATRGDERERVRVADPGRFGTPTLTDVDVLVAARDREAVQRTAAAAGVRYLAPADVRELLLYGVERSAAATQFERTFGQPLETDREPAPTLRERVQAAGAVAGHAVTAHVEKRTLVVLLLVGCVAAAAIAGPALTTRPEEQAAVAPIEAGTVGDVGAVGARTVTPTETPGAVEADDGRPPGVGEEALEDHVALADAHTESVLGKSRTIRMAASGPPDAPVLRGREAWNMTARIEHPRLYLHDVSARFPGENGSSTFTVSIYADGDTKFRQATSRNETTYQRYAIETTGDASGFASDVRQYLLRFLDGDASSVECVATLAGADDCFARRVVVTGAPPAVHEEANDYRAIAIVQDDGVVASLTVNYTIPVDGERVPVHFELEYDKVGATTVSPPVWLETAKNETSD